MTERNLFRVSMRIIGVVMFSLGVGDVLASALTAIGIQSSRYYSALDRGGAGLIYMLTGLVLFLAANAVTNLLYGRDEKSI